MKLKNVFLKGRMNKDADERLLTNDEYVHAENAVISSVIDGDTGVLKNAKSNQPVSNLTFEGTDPTCIGSVADDANNRLYWFVWTTSGSYVCEYDHVSGTSSIILEDTRTGDQNVLNFQKHNKIHSANILNDTDNGRDFLFWTDGFNPPRKINIQRAKEYLANGFSDEDVSVIVKPPLSQPEIELTYSGNRDDSFLKDKFVQFAYRYKYLDGEYSALSPFSEYAFHAKTFYYDFEEATNESMQNEYNQANVKVNTGGPNVVSFDIVFRESESTNIYLIENISKVKNKLNDNEEYVLPFKNSKVYTVLPSDEYKRLYDAVPLKAETQDLIGNRLLYANYTENYDIVDVNNEDLKFDFTLNNISYYVNAGSPTRTVKSGRSYEAGIVYLDDYGRMSTVMICENNNVTIPIENCTQRNTLQLTINNVAPKWAKYYRVFIKENKTQYDTITPIIFHTDNEFVWVKVEKSDIDKFKEGEFLIVKSDTSGIKRSYIETKVLEFGQKERNFLDTGGTASPGEILQEEGTYIKLKPTKYSINDAGYKKKSSSNTDDSSKKSGEDNPRITNEQNVNYFEGPFYYDVAEGSLNDMTITGTPNSPIDERFEIVVDSVGNTDTFKWRAWSENGATQWVENLPMNQSYSLQSGLGISFAAVTGHFLGEKWTVNSKTPITDYNETERSQIILEGFEGDETVGPGSTMRLYYQEYRGSAVTSYSSSIAASRYYPNIEEWWHEMVKDEMTATIPEANIRWRRGVATETGDERTRTLSVTNNINDPLYLIIDTTYEQTSVINTGIGFLDRALDNLSSRVFSEGSWNIVLKDRDDSLLVFETKPEVSNNDIFYEVGQTYEVSEQGYHMGQSTDRNQTQGRAALITLDFFNAFTWGNAIESYKYKDAFNAPEMLHNARPLVSYEGYAENNRIASLTYGGVYQQNTNFNGLNEFNLSLSGFRDLDDKYGSIQKIISRDDDIIVFQENKISKIMFGKSVLYNADGTGNVGTSADVLGSQIPYVGEYGISKSPGSVAKWYNDIFVTDDKRGTAIRLGPNGLEDISQYGMKDWFRENVGGTDNPTLIGGYDPYNDLYVLSVQDAVVEWREDDYYCEKGNVSWVANKYYCEQLQVITTTTTSTTTTTTTTLAPTTTTTLAPTTTTTQAPTPPPPTPTPPTPTPPTPPPTTTACSVNCGTYSCGTHGSGWFNTSFNCSTGAINVSAYFSDQTLVSYSPTSATPNSGTVTVTASFYVTDPYWTNSGTTITCTVGVDTTCATPTTAAPTTTTTEAPPPTTTTTTTSAPAPTTTTTTSAPAQTCYAHQVLYSSSTTCQGNPGVYYTDNNNWCSSTKLYASSSACAADNSAGFAPPGYYTYEVAPGSYEYSYWNGSSFSQMCTPC